jgi:Peptidase family M28/PDZ domain/PA domain
MHRLFRPFAAIFTTFIFFGCHHESPTLPPHPTALTTAPTTQHPTTALSTYREADEIKTTLTYIASDDLEGRGLLTAGVQKAADYIAQHFQTAGLQPLPNLSGYFQPFPITLDRKLADTTTLSLGDKPLNPGTDFSPVTNSSESTFTGEPVFVGYSITDPDSHYDDFAGIDVKGKVAIAFRYEPPAAGSTTAPTGPPQFSEHATFQSKADTAAARGAVALLIVNRFQDPDTFTSLRDHGQTESTKIPVIQVSRAAIAKLLESAENGDLPKLQKDIDSTHTPKSFAILGSTISGNVAFKTDRRTYRNVVGYLPGHGPHKDEFIVIGAHYDHLGRGEIGSLAVNSHQIHNGADDNGSGTCAVMEIAKTIHQLGPGKFPLDRSLIFICFCGEERGLLGSQYFVEHPPVPLEKIAAMLNLDMVGRVRNDVIYDGGTGTAKDFDSFVEHADADSPLIVKTAGADVGGRGGFGPSDHMNFAEKQIPVLFFWSGMEPDYHRPTDKVDKINFVGIAEVVDFSRSIIAELSTMPREQYISASDHWHMGGVGSMRVRLGIMPDYNTNSSAPGVRIAAVMPDSAAAQAGLKEGDVIVGFDKDKVDSLGDYMTILAKHKPGDVVDVVLQRTGQRMTLKATLLAPQSD